MSASFVDSHDLESPGWSLSTATGSVYTRPDPLGIGTKLVWISVVFTRGLMDPVWIRSAIGSTYEGDSIWNRTVPVSNRSRVNSGSVP